MNNLALVDALQKILKVLASSVPIDYKRDCREAMAIANGALAKLAKEEA